MLWAIRLLSVNSFLHLDLKLPTSRGPVEPAAPEVISASASVCSSKKFPKQTCQQAYEFC